MAVRTGPLLPCGRRRRHAAPRTGSAGPPNAVRRVTGGGRLASLRGNPAPPRVAMLCFLPPLPAAPRPEPPPAPAPLPDRAAEAVLFIFIVLNVFVVIAAFLPPLIGPANLKPLRSAPAGAVAACGARSSGSPTPSLSPVSGVVDRPGCGPA